MAEIERRWRACCFIEYSLPKKYPEMHPPGAPDCSCLGSEWMTLEEARNHLYKLRSVVCSRSWLFWVEPENMTDEERQRYRPGKARERMI